MNRNLKYIYLNLPSVLQTILVSSNGLFNFLKRKGGGYKDYLKFYNQSYYWEEGKIEEYQTKQLVSLISELIKYTSYPGIKINEEFNYNLHEGPYSILCNFCFIEKDVIREKFNSVVNNNPKRKPVLITQTSGTTGTPLIVQYDKDSIYRSFALWKRFHNIIGLPKRFKSVRFSGRILIKSEKSNPPFWCYNYFERQLLMSSYHLTTENMRYYVQKLNQFKPLLIDGYPSAIYTLAYYINHSNSKLDFKLKAVATTAETLHDYQRKEIEKAFDCKVYNQYASSEGGPFITECTSGTLHLNLDSGVFEFYNKEGNVAQPGEIAEMIVTSFRQLKTPLVRYRTGDFVRIPKDSSGVCSCGSTMPHVVEILGRDDDMLYTNDKGFIGRMDPAYKGLTGIVKSQIIQHDLNNVEIVQIVDKKYTAIVEKLFLRNLRDRLGSEVNIVISNVDSIPLGNNGKFKTVIRKFEI